MGHNHPFIVEAIKNQLNELDYAPAIQFGHFKSFQLAEKIVEFMPSGLNHVFFTISESELVNTAFKMAKDYWYKKGNTNKTKLIRYSRCSHKTLSDHSSYLSLNNFSLNELNEIITFHGKETIAAVIIEPICILSSMSYQPKEYFNDLKDICINNDILLIFDETISAFGRIGTKTAAETFDITPDMLLTARQLTNGIMPMGAVIVSSEIYNTFIKNGISEYNIEFPHGEAYFANPIACAAALATLKILENENIFLTVLRLTHTIEKMWQKGFYLHFIGNTIQFALPFKVTYLEIDNLFNALSDTLYELKLEYSSVQHETNIVL